MRFPPGRCSLLPTCPLCRQPRRGRLVFWPQDEMPHQLPAPRKRLLVQLIVWPSSVFLPNESFLAVVTGDELLQRYPCALLERRNVPSLTWGWKIASPGPWSQIVLMSSDRKRAPRGAEWSESLLPPPRRSSASLLTPPSRSSLRAPTTPALPWSTVRSFKKYIQTNIWGVFSSKAKNVMNFQSC